MNGVPERLRDLRSSRHGREFEDMITKLLTVAWRRRLSIIDAAQHGFVTAA